MHSFEQSITGTRALTAKEVRAVLKVSENIVRDARWRRRVGRRAVHVGTSLRFLASECEALLARGLERLPAHPGAGEP